MIIRTVEYDGRKIALADGEGEIIISDAQSALDFIAGVRYETGANCVALDKAAVCGDFFALSTGLAGEVLQKFVNYRIKLAIYGDFSKYTSVPLRDFIRESNRGRDIFFASDEKNAIARLADAK